MLRGLSARLPSRHDPEPHDTAAADGRQPSMLRGLSEQLGRRPTFRRMSFDAMHSGGGREGELGLFGNFRRHSLDARVALRDMEQAENTAMHDYHEMFKSIRREHPTASLGAIQQMAMARMAETKILREEEERHREDEQRLQKQGFVDRCIDKMGLSGPFIGGLDCDLDDDDGNSLHLSGPSSDGSFLVQLTVPGGTRPSMITMKHYMSERRASLDSGTMGSAPSRGRRRASGDSSLQSTLVASCMRRASTGSETFQSSLAESASRSSQDMYVLAGLVPGSDEGHNLAPKKSVGDMSRKYGHCCNFEEDRSVQSGLSSVSGLFIDAESVATSPSRLSRRGKMRGPGIDDGSDDDVTSVASDTNAMGSVSRGPRMRRSVDSSSRCSLASLARSLAGSMASDCTDYTRASGGGLIVGFGAQRASRNERTDGLIVGFVDRSDMRGDVDVPDRT